MVDVEHRPLRALEEDAPAGVDRVVEVERGVGDVAAQAIAVAAVRVVNDVELHRLFFEDRPEVDVLLLEVALELFAERLLLEEIDEADARPRHLVLVGRPDAAPRRPDLAFAAQALAREVDRLVVRHDQVRLVADLEARVVGQVAAGAERGQLRDQYLRIDHDAVGDDADLSLMQHARRDQVQHRLLLADEQRVTGVVAAAEAHDDVGVAGEDVDDLALALVAPLHADDDDGAHRPLRASVAAPR